MKSPDGFITALRDLAVMSGRQTRQKLCAFPHALTRTNPHLHFLFAFTKRPLLGKRV